MIIWTSEEVDYQKTQINILKPGIRPDKEIRIIPIMILTMKDGKICSALINISSTKCR